MNHNFRFYIMFLLGLLLLNACSSSVSGAADVVLPTAVSSFTIPTTVPTTGVAPRVTEMVGTETAVPTATTVPVETAVTVLNTNVQYVIALTDVNVRSGPGIGYGIISWIADGQTAKVTGVNSDNSWWRVICPDDSIGSCWVTAGGQYTQIATAPVSQPLPTPTATACLDAATFVTDVTVPDGTLFSPNSSFNKTWRIKNSGSCTWDSRYKLVHAGGHVLGAAVTSFALPATVAPGQTIDLGVNLIAPADAGVYEGSWKLKNPQGQAFGIGQNHNNPFWVNIQVATPRAGSISGFAWQDQDQDNVVDGNEMLPYVAVTLATGTNCGQVVMHGQADSNGRFTFINLAAGTYCLSGSDSTVTIGQTVVLAQNQQLTDVKIVWPPLDPQTNSITGLVYQDSNENGVYDNGEVLMANREVWLIVGTVCQVQSNPVEVAVSGADGRYTMTGKFSGYYCVSLKGENGMEDVLGIAVNNGQTMSDINLKAHIPGGSISGWVWNDYCVANGTIITAGNCVADGNGGYRADGMIQPTEGYIAGVTILLQIGTCATDNPAVPVAAATDAYGRYIFNNLLPGTYCVFMNAAENGNGNILLPGDWTFPQPHIWYHQVALVGGEQVAPVNFGWDYQLQ